MNKGKKLGFLIVFVSIAFIGLLWTQYLWITNNIAHSEQEFDQKVSKLVSDVVKKVENANYCIDLFGKVDLSEGQELSLLTANDQNQLLSKVPLFFRYAKTPDTDTIYRMDSLLFGLPSEIEMRVNVRFIIDSLEEKSRPVQNFGDLEYAKEERKIDLRLLDTLLDNTFKTNGIKETFEYLVRGSKSNNVVFCSSKNPDDLLQSGLTAKLFSNSNYQQAFELFIHFPDKNAKAIRNNLFTILSSLALVIMLVLLFTTFFKMLLKERKLSEMKVDFVNNITHEFRTPLSNIKLAANALRKELPPDSDNHLIEIIEEENNRLQKGIDLALTTSLLNREEILLNKQEHDLHEVITRLTHGNMLMHNSNGKIELKLQAGNPSLHFDELHMTNAFNTLIHNAIKYCNVEPEICISTIEQKNGIEVQVKDNGIGISQKDIPYIFDRFYRVSTQNRHETRGYGIGLYYVKMIIEAHGGKVSATSTPQVGSTFKIFIPKHA